MNEQDVARLYREYGYLVFRRCVVYLGDVNAARDATRDVFLRVLKNPTSLRAFADSATWLCRVTDAMCIDLLGRADAEEGHNRVLSDDAALGEAVCDDDRESLLMVRRLLVQLELDDLRFAVLYYVDELTEEELARELGLSRRTVTKRITQLLEHSRALSHQRNAS